MIGVTGGIAAFKAAEVVSRLVKAGCNVHVCMTPSAVRFISPLTFAALTGRRTVDQVFPEQDADQCEDIYPHLYPATKADAFAMVPATAHAIAKLACGFGEDAVSCSALSLKAECKRILCPAMNVQMWEQPVVAENIKRLLQRGWQQVGPEGGRLACGTVGYGRMSAPDTIAKAILNSVL